MSNAMTPCQYKFNTKNAVYLKVKRENLNRSYRTVTVRFSSYDVERINRYLMEKKISQSELLRKIASEKEQSFTVKNLSGSMKLLSTLKTFSVDDKLYKKIASWSKELNIPTATLVRELILAGIEE
ncbi:hypothetical protein [Carboxydothermus pertinax]|nr:hypothetical protein [Carboxydothermus pertinax]